MVRKFRILIEHMIWFFTKFSHILILFFTFHDPHYHHNFLSSRVINYFSLFSIGNSGEIPTEVTAAIEKGELVTSAVLSGNRNFEGRVHPATRANYLASPP